MGNDCRDSKAGILPTQSSQTQLNLGHQENTEEYFAHRKNTELLPEQSAYGDSITGESIASKENDTRSVEGKPSAVGSYRMSRVEHISNRAASRILARAVILLTRAGEQLSAASHLSPDRYHRNKFHRLALGLREFSLPLSRAASLLERGGDR